MLTWSEVDNIYLFTFLYMFKVDKQRFLYKSWAFWKQNLSFRQHIKIVAYSYFRQRFSYHCDISVA